MTKVSTKDGFNAVGAGVAPRLGARKPVGLASPGGASGTRGVKGDTSIKRTARPGGRSAAPASGGKVPKSARPGVRESAAAASKSRPAY